MNREKIQDNFKGNIQRLGGQIGKILTIWLGLLGLIWVLASPLSYAEVLSPDDFTLVCEQGFGDRHNSVAWSMKWWENHLYVGTSRAYRCFQQAVYNTYFPSFIPYPPSDPDVECTPEPQDLPLQAEIWRWTPDTDMWDRVYQSPNDLEIPAYPGKYVAPDIGFRDATVFTEPDQTEAIYFSGFSSRDFNGYELPLPRILRSADGINFEPIPQDPETFLGDLDNRIDLVGREHVMGFRAMSTYNGRLYVVAGGAYGDGTLLEAANPAGGNDNFRQVTPPDMTIFSILPYNGLLYIGTGARALPPDPSVPGYAVLKTDATGDPPYDFVPVVTDGAYLLKPSKTVVHMEEVENRLYAGTNQPAELIRINPDDTWDLVVGEPRMTPDGMKYPLSGFGPGFDWEFGNIHMHRIQAHDGVLYVGTNDHSTSFRNIPIIDLLFHRKMGFDLYATPNGWYFEPITTTGFGDIFNESARTFASTPYGLFLGSQSSYYGLNIWRGSKDIATMLSPDRLETEYVKDKVILSWEAPKGASRYRIFRAKSVLISEIMSPDLLLAEMVDEIVGSGGVPDEWLTELQDCGLQPDDTFMEPFVEIGSTNQSFFVGEKMSPTKPFCHYYVVAEDDRGKISQPSNLVRSPSLAPAVTFGHVRDKITKLLKKGKVKSTKTVEKILSTLQKAEDKLQKAEDKLQKAKAKAETKKILMEIKSMEKGLDSWHAEDLDVLLAKLIRRVELSEIDLLCASELY